MTSRGPECLDEATLLAFFEGELSGSQRTAVDAHIDGCPTCLAVLAAVGRTEGKPGDPERYEIREEVGAGGMGQVFEAFDTVLGRIVALKCVRAGPEDEAAAKRFEREMALTARLQHPSIIPVYDAGVFPDGSRYFAMRMVEGRTLDAAIEEAATVEARLALVPSIRRVCEAVAYAHEQSVIHRDLKPANVLIGPFGETVVLDWGLAKLLSEDDPQGESLHGESGDAEMTRPGAVMGTPGYIAPEVMRGEAAGPRSDVFSLGRILEKLLPGGQGEGRREVLADFGAVVGRATADEASLRYPSAAQLCDDLQRFEAGQTVSARDYSLPSRARRFVRRHRRPIVGSLAFASVGAIGGLGVASAIRSDGPRPCTGAEEALAGTWDEAKRAEVHGAFAATNVPHAGLAGARTTEALDAYAGDWVSMHTAACEATAQGEQSATLLDLRMTCLDRAQVELRAAVEVLSTADAAVVENAAELIRGLFALDRCADRDALEAEVEPPPNDEAAKVEDARASLARADALRLAARHDAAAQAIDEARQTLDGVTYAPVRTDLALSDGLLLEARGEYDEAEIALTNALRSGTRWGQREQVREAALGLMFVVGVRQVDATGGLRYRSIAEALSVDSPAAEGDFRDRLGAVLYTDGDYDASAEQHRKAMAIREQLGDRVGLATALNNYAIALRDLGELEPAEAALRAVLQERIELLGPDHPTTADTHANLAISLNGLGRAVEAEAEARTALDIHLRTLPAEHLAVVSTRITLGRSSSSLGKYDEAIEQFRAALSNLDPDDAHVVTIRHNLGSILVAQRKFDEAAAEFAAALELLEKTWGADHPRQVPVRIGLAAAHFYRENFAEAEAQFRGVLKILSKAPKPNPLEVASARTGLSQALLAQGKQTEGLAELRAALELYEGALEADHPLVATTQYNLAEALFDVGRHGEALPLAERAWARRQADDIPASSRASTAFLLARLLWQGSPQERRRARELAQKAREAFAGAGDAYAESEQSVEQWLQKHGR